MKVKNSISTIMRTLKGRETKDKEAKNIFSYKPIMSNIQKYTVAEYRDCSLEEIMNCIEGDTIRTGQSGAPICFVLFVILHFPVELRTISSGSYSIRII